MKDYIRIFGRKVLRNSVLYKTLRFIARTGPVLGPFLEPRVFDITNTDIAFDHLPPDLDGMKILHISDIHAGDYIRKKYLQRMVDQCNTLNHDLVVITGDFTETEFDDIHWCAEILSKINNKLGIFGVYGNHDVWNGGEEIGKVLQENGITILNNRNIPLEYNRQQFYLAGVDDYRFGNLDLNSGLKDIPEEAFVILMSHNPDSVEVLNGHKVDLMLSGHMHGGQWRFPLIGPLYVPSKFKTKHFLGLSKSNGTAIYTTCGIGSTSIPLRINCNPEISIITLKKSS